MASGGNATIGAKSAVGGDIKAAGVILLEEKSSVAGTFHRSYRTACSASCHNRRFR